MRKREKNNLLLHEAVRGNRRDIVADLVSRDGNNKELVNSSDGFAQTPLHIAASNGFTELVQLLLQNGADVRQVDRNSWTPLHSAANAGQFAICKILLEHGSEASALTDAGTTALHYLVRHTTDDAELFREVLTMLINQGCEVDSQNKYGETPLHQASFRGKKQSVEFLIEHSADVNITTKAGETSLHFAARTGRGDIVSLLLAAGADPMRRGDYGTCKDVAVTANHTNIIALLDRYLETQTKKKPMMPVTDDPPSTSFLPQTKNLLVGLRGIQPRQRRLRHINFIMARNLGDADTNRLLDTYFTLHEKEDSKPFYTSEVVPATLNPKWRRIDPSQFVDIESSAGECVIFVVRLWTCHIRERHRLVAQCIIDLNRLGYVGETEVGFGSFPPNSLLFDMGDGLYTRDDTIAAMSSAGQLELVPPSIEVRKTGKTSGLRDFTRLIATKRRLNEMRAKAKENRLAIEKMHAARLQCLNLAHKRDLLKVGVAELKKELEARQKTLQVEREVVRDARALLVPRARALSKSQIAFLAHNQQLIDERKAFDTDRALLIAILRSLDRRRWKLIGELNEIYPVHNAPTDNHCLCICGIRLPNSDSFLGCDEEEVATALGSVCHIILLISKYLEVPLRYPMRPMCSRSFVLDEITADVPTKYPLYYRGVDKQSFATGVFLLNKNVEVLLESQNIRGFPLRHTLRNVQKLMQSASERQSPSGAPPTGRRGRPSVSATSRRPPRKTGPASSASSSSGNGRENTTLNNPNSSFSPSSSGSGVVPIVSSLMNASTSSSSSSSSSLLGSGTSRARSLSLTNNNG
jgi:ankyrin repeat protein